MIFLFFLFSFSKQISIDSLTDGEWILYMIKHEKVDLYFHNVSIEFHKNENDQLVSSIYRNDIPRSTDIMDSIIVDFYNVTKKENQLIFSSTLKNIGQSFSLSYNEIQNEQQNALTLEGEAFGRNISLTFHSLREGKGVIDGNNYSLKHVDPHPAPIPPILAEEEKVLTGEEKAKTSEYNGLVNAFAQIRKYVHQFEDYVSQYVPLFKEWSKIFYVLFFVILLEILFIIYLCTCKSTPKQQPSPKKVHTPSETKEKVD